MALRHEPVVADGRPGRRPPPVERVPHRDGGRCVTHRRSDGTTPPEAGAPARQRVLLACSEGGITRGIERKRVRSASPRRDAHAEHVRVPPQGPLRPPAPRGSRVGPRGARAEQKRAPRAAQAVPGREALSTKIGDAHAEHAPEGLVHPAVAWASLGAHVVNAKGARGALEWGVVSVRSLLLTY